MDVYQKQLRGLGVAERRKQRLDDPPQAVPRHLQKGMQKTKANGKPS